MLTEAVKRSFPGLLNTSDESQFLAWREEKMRLVEGHSNDPVMVADFANPSPAEIRAIIEQCNRQNYCIYQIDESTNRDPQIGAILRSFAQAFGMKAVEDHRSSDGDGVVHLRMSNDPSKSGYIPYSNRPINWHTDGYYNAADNQIRSMVLHCVRSAENGGQSQLLDQEIAFLRLWDENPEFIAALCHPEAMTIPENVEPNGNVRPESRGPVFSLDPKTGKLVMRYTIRKKYIIWRDDPATRAAVEFLNALLGSQDPFILTATLAPGQGVICNNCLHNRTGFDGDSDTPSVRHLLRARFNNRISGETSGQA